MTPYRTKSARPDMRPSVRSNMKRLTVLSVERSTAPSTTLSTIPSAKPSTSPNVNRNMKQNMKQSMTKFASKFQSRHVLPSVRRCVNCSMRLNTLRSVNLLLRSKTNTVSQPLSPWDPTVLLRPTLLIPTDPPKPHLVNRCPSKEKLKNVEMSPGKPAKLSIKPHVSRCPSRCPNKLKRQFALIKLAKSAPKLHAKCPSKFLRKFANRCQSRCLRMCADNKKRRNAK